MSVGSERRWEELKRYTHFCKNYALFRINGWHREAELFFDDGDFDVFLEHGWELVCADHFEGGFFFRKKAKQKRRRTKK